MKLKMSLADLGCAVFRTKLFYLDTSKKVESDKKRGGDAIPDKWKQQEQSHSLENTRYSQGIEHQPRVAGAETMNEKYKVT